MSAKAKIPCKPYFKRRHLFSAAARAAAASAGAGPWSAFPICARLYNWPTGLPGGGVIAIVELGGGWVALSDMTAFSSNLSISLILKSLTFR